MADIASVNNKLITVELKRAEKVSPDAASTDEKTGEKTSKVVKDSFIPSDSSKESENDYTKILNSDNTRKPKNVKDNKSTENSTGKKELTPKQNREVEKLKKIDSETRAHEAAHIAAGSDLVRGGASFSYQKGPDGKSYAVGGEVQIDISPESDPDNTIQKMDRVRRAAMAPAEPSSQDRQVASRAAQIQSEARSEKSNMNSQSYSSANAKESSDSREVVEQSPEEKPDSDNLMKSEQINRSYTKSSGIEADKLGTKIDIQISGGNFQKLKT